MRIITLIATFVASTGAAMAHTGHGTHDNASFAYGFMHPLGGLDHLLAMVAVGLLAYLIGERTATSRPLWLVPAAFVCAMTVGGTLAVAGVTLPLVELGIASSIVVIGAAAAFGSSLPVAGAMALVGFFALFHGHAHGTEMPANASGMAYGLGFMVATALLHAAGVAAGLGIGKLSRANGVLAARAGGGVMALAGIAIIAGVL
ncbi:HupE/UreJ family protein [Pararhizobium haloflavum]|uniref:HupE/UreJ family protein n=1 Tax=Pararhizobium haloflavum TaxID=2037914 RepID=UPI000C18515A|nr:HupE/UreJ family protein [Pararhizobium haloflavum]